MNKTTKRTFCKEYNNGYDSARELTLELLDRYRSLYRYHRSSGANQLKMVDGVQKILDCIDMSYWRDDTSPDQIMTMIREIEKYLVIIKSAAGSPPVFLILEGKVNAALNRCIDVLAC